MGLLAFHTRLSKIQLATLALTGVAQFLLFVAILTPSWQVAEDTDVGRSIQSGLWIYCPGSSQCWYIFSDDLINYYERVDVCRFLLIGDCRKKLLRTPYFFGWHYAVLIIMLIVMALGTGALVCLGLGMLRKGGRVLRISTVLLDILLGFAFLLCGVGLAVFLINAEMLESRYLIGIKNTFEKSYGYSFFLACLAATVLLFALLSAIVLTSAVFFMRDADAGEPASDEYGEFDEGGHQPVGGGGGGRMMPDSRTANYVLSRTQPGTEVHPPLGHYNKVGGGTVPSAMMGSGAMGYQSAQRSLQASPMPMKFDDFGAGRAQHMPRYCYAPSDATSIP